ncbi:hypothetical protein BVC71_15040 [Marivivens niveibacter]|uniref:Biopolymer transporter ExbD n=1 Tax=Marivivens niveibacter TaxID=1930667 RepID=A0A251WV41_9RHOB|nr:biopolymer transporter ExbD [Marivivens niveibacter]OUD08121.1 hypothetical protein BVC71_15040 [Marivivens niveibacter]
MALRQPISRQRQEPTIALINIVFLMLVFFLVAGTITANQAGDVNLVTVADLAGQQPADAVVIYADGSIYLRGEPVDVQSAVLAMSSDTSDVVRLMPDRDLPAQELVRIAGEFANSGAKNIVVVTERGTSQ